MQEINIVTPGLNNIQIIIGILIALFIIIAMPMVGSLLLWLSAKFFKFKNQSFKTTLKCIFITFSVTILTNMILFTRNVTKNQYLHVLALVLTGLVVEFICVKKIFKASNGKTIGVIITSFLAGIILFVLFIVLLSLILNLVMPGLFF